MTTLGIGLIVIGVALVCGGLILWPRAPQREHENQAGTRPPYGSTMGQYEKYMQLWKKLGISRDPERIIQRICHAKDMPGKPRQALLGIGFTHQEIAETDTVELVVKYLKRLHQIVRDGKA